MRKLLIIFFLLIGSIVNAQTFTQTFVDRCTGEVKVVTANFVNGSATVAFYNKVRVFTYAEFTSGVLQQWLLETYNWWNTLSPCSTTTQQVQQAQQTAQAAQQAAQTAQSAASSAATAASSASSAATAATSATTPPPTNTSTGGTSGTTQSTNTNTNESSNTTTSNTSEGSSTETGGSTSEGGGGESKSSETKSEETETKSGESSEENSSESSEESKSEEGADEESSSDDGDGEESEEVKEEKKEDSKKEEKKKKVITMLPIQLKADAMAMQNPLGGYNAAMSIGASQSSIFGDVSYSATLMVFDNLSQATFGLGKSKVYMNESYNVDWIESIGLSYGNNFGTQSISGNVMRLKPMNKKGTFGLGINYTFMFGGMIEKPMGSMGYNFLYTNTLTKPTARLTYSPAFIISQTPLSFTLDSKSVANSDAMFILANSFTYRLTKRFTFNFGYTAIKSTNPIIPLISSFMVGSKIPF